MRWSGSTARCGRLSRSAIETTGYTQWFHALMHRLGHTVLVGEARKIRAMVIRQTKTDRRDARHLLDLLRHDRFPTVWMPDPDHERSAGAGGASGPPGSHAHHGEERLAGDRPQPAAGPPLAVVDRGGSCPPARPRAASAHAPPA